MKSRPVLFKFTAIIALIVAGLVAGILTAKLTERGNNPVRVEGMLWPNPKQLYPFATIDHNGILFGLDSLKGRWSFIFFGYTNCPDICPLTLTGLNQVYKQIISERISSIPVQILFVSVDPQRDDPGRLADYVTYFNEDFIGLGGRPEQIQSIARQLGALYIDNKPASDSDVYQVDHSASVFLISPDARLISVFSAPHLAEPIISRFRAILEFLHTVPDA